VLEKQGKLFYEVAKEWEGEVQTHFLKGHKKAITAVEWMPDGKSVFTASKDCCLIRWDLETGKKLVFKGDKYDKSVQGHTHEALCLATNGKYMISGGKDRVVRVWDIHN